MAKYDKNKFTFDLRADDTRMVFRPNEVLVRDLRNPDILDAAFDAAGRGGSERRDVESNLVPDRVVNDAWGVVTLADGIDPRDVVDVLLGTVVDALPVRAQLNNVYFSGSVAASAGHASNRAAPNYAVPNYAVPNYAVPNYAVPNYAVPNYAVPNYAVPNYAVGQGGYCACQRCLAPADIPPDVPPITARKARVPFADLGPRVNGDLEIHVLDVRPQIDAAIEANGPPFVDQNRDVYVASTQQDADKLTLRNALKDTPGALLSESLYLRDHILSPTTNSPQDPSVPAAQEARYDELRSAYVVEPFSEGLGANVNQPPDNYVDPTTNHGEFIKGIIDRIVRPLQELGTDPATYVHMHSVMGTLGDISDAELAKAMEHIDAEHNTDDSPRIMSLSLAGYPELKEGEDDCLAETVAALQLKSWKIVASAGNDANCRPTRPASLPGVVAVAAYGPAGPAGFSNYGPWVDACAPGVDIVSDFPDIKNQNLLIHDQLTSAKAFDTGYAAWSGTSFSAPFAAAIIARWMLTKGEDFEQALDELLLHKNALQYPGYGTIMSFATTRKLVESSGDWI